MKNIVIAAGYATRLGELTKNFPKPLLKIGENTILGRMLDDIDRIPEIDEHIIITNNKFAGIFEDWKKDLHYSKPITIVDDGTETNETRLGAVCDLLYAMDKLHIDDDLLVVAADNLLFFSFQEFVDFAHAKGTSCLYVGDADLKNGTNTKLVQDFLKVHLNETMLLLMQIPHHGSQYNIGALFETDFPAHYYFVNDVDTKRLQKSPGLFKSLTGQKKLLVSRGKCQNLIGTRTVM